jgi:hypothetical protein
MNPSIFSPNRFWQRLSSALVACVFVGFVLPVPAAAAARKLLQIELSKDRKTAVVQVPAGYESVTLQRFHRDGGWRKVMSRKADAKVLRIKLPASAPDIRWRVIGNFRKSASRGKFPAGFYQGENSFGALKSKNGPGVPAPGIPADRDLSGAGDPPESENPEEADIWKTDGTTVYFFNQYRGLQVLDVSDPADPRLTATLRLPAAGEDLYLLPGSGPVRHLVLLTDQSGGKGPMTRINLVKVAGPSVEITHFKDVPGQRSDSRMAGNRLILATTEWSSGVVVDDTVTAETYASTLSQWVITPDQAPKADVEFAIEGDYPIIAAGGDWLAVAVTPPGQWSYSEVTVFGLETTGLVKLTPAPIRTAGVVADKFKLQWRDNILTTISEKNRTRWDWSPVTVLETFRVWGAGVIHPMVIEGRLGRLELAEGESLYATRFAGNKAYVVTFLETDPLWVVDLSDPKKPTIAGHLEVPGWSSHLEPLGDLLLSIGWESNTIAASLFDVADPAAPVLVRRLNLGTPGSYSEAAWDEQALRVLPDAGLVMIPLTTYDSKTGQSLASVQLLDLDLAGRNLTLRGAISHEFDARRSDLIGKAVVSISQRVMVAADVSDRDAPSILSEVSLAWPVDRVLDAGGHLLQVETGTGYGQSRATVRVSPADSPEAVIAEVDLGDGSVRGADFRDGKLYILREVGSAQAIYYRSPVTGERSGKLVLDVYDGSSLPSLTLLGSVSTRLDPGMQVAGNGLLWPQPNRPAVVIDAQSSFWYWDRPIGIDPPVMLVGAPAAKSSLVAADRFPFWRPRKAPRVLVFEVTGREPPTAGAAFKVGTVETIPNGLYEAADGLIVIGASDMKVEANGKLLEAGKVIQSAHVVEVGTSGDPVVRPGIDLPGGLFAVSELDRNGFLAFTRSIDSGDGPGLKVSACDGFDAFEIAGLDERAEVVATAGGRRLFVVKSRGVERHRLTDEGTFTSEPRLEIGWNPYQLRWTGGTLLGAQWNALFAAGETDAAASKWEFQAWSLMPEQIKVAGDGDLLVPFGEFGVERLSR